MCAGHFENHVLEIMYLLNYRKLKKHQVDINDFEHRRGVLARLKFGIFVSSFVDSNVIAIENHKTPLVLCCAMGHDVEFYYFNDHRWFLSCYSYRSFDNDRNAYELAEMFHGREWQKRGLIFDKGFKMMHI